MYLPYWKRTLIFNDIPYLKGNSDLTYHMKDFILNPENLDFWNFFIRYNKVRNMTNMVKEVAITSLLSIDGDNALEVAISSNYLPLLKEVLNKITIQNFQYVDNEGIGIIDIIFSSKFSIYKEIILFIKNNNLQNILLKKHMILLINSDIEKMIYFEKILPGLFLKLYEEKIDSLPPHFQYVLLKHDLLKIKLNKILKKKNTKKLLIKI